MSQILDGKRLASQIHTQIVAKVATLARPPGLGVLLVGDDPASQVYVGRKAKVAEKLGFVHHTVVLPGSASEEEVLCQLAALHERSDLDGILVQLPLPSQVRADVVAAAIDPIRDVDGITPVNAGLLALGRPSMVPCTPAGILRLISESGFDWVGKRALVVGRSNIVGRPVAHLLEQAHLTVTLAHSRTEDLRAEVERADLLIAAIGRARAIPGAWVRLGAVVIDVGVNRLKSGQLVGDVEFESAALRASAITPVPGGVGPMTIAMLMENTLKAAIARGASR